jgi:O-antigen/teichoic acid export membrane protein
MASLLSLFGQIISLIVIFLLTKFTSGSLIFLGLALGVAPTLVIIAANLYFFKTKYKDFSPSIKFVRKKYAKDIMGIGLKFFVLQIASIVQYQTILFLIAHYFDPLQVTSYNIAYKYFGVLQMGFMILLTPIWSSTTDAYNSGDLEWIKNIVKKYVIILLPFVITGAFMLAVAEPVYNLWLGKGIVSISFNMSLLCYIYFSTQMFGGIFVQVLNGIGALQIQFYSSFLTSIGYLLLSLTLIKVFHMGIESILISSILSNIFGFIIAPIQYYKIFIKKSRLKIWYS